MPDRHLPSILLLMGVAGSGKTTTGQRLARQLGWEFRDADSFHPAANIAKMSAGQPLNDDDRLPWLDAIADWIDKHRGAGTKAIVSCSALKRVYRKRLMAQRPEVQLIYLKGTPKLIADRMSRRKGHFMPPALLDSQFAALEAPRGSERPIIVNVAMPPNRVIEHILIRTGLGGARSNGLPKVAIKKLELE
jgi:carbohydrate kinase (thermoresistant glucokinase family)